MIGKSLALHPWLRPKSRAIVEACSIGLVSALGAVWLKNSITWLEMWRRSANEQTSPWIALPIIGIAGGLLSGWLIEKVAPEASGSGIPQVKAALGYAPIALDLRVAAVKLVSTSLSLGSGLALGRQGPTVQIGAALAAQLSHWTATSPAYRRQLVAAGAAAGLAAGFNAPIAGVLFAIEELLQDLSDVTLGTAILAAFVGGVVSRLLGGRGLIPELDGIDTSFHLIDIPFLLVLGLTAGLLGGLLSRGILASLSVNRHLLRTWTLSWRMALAGGMTGVILAALPPLLRRSSELQDALVLGGMDWQLKALALVTQFGLIAIAYGSGAPGGLFAPCLILGSALGGLVVQGAMGLQNLGGLPANLALSSPTIYALTGMGAFFSAVTRGPITAIVIVFEMTADFNLVLPLMIGSITSSLVAQEVFKGSIYQHLLELRGIYLGNSDPSDRRWSELKAADIMERRVETLPSQMTIREAIQTFAKSHHRGFPVVAQGKLVGIISQSETPGRIFGDVADTAIRQAPCDVILVKLGIKSLRLNRWLVPMAGGPNARYAIGLLPALVTLSQNPEINLCQVFHPSEPYQKPTLLTQEAKYLKKQTSCAVNSISLCATSVAEAALDLTEKQQCDAILLGASRESMLQQVIQGNIPEAIARNCNCTVILVRKAE